MTLGSDFHGKKIAKPRDLLVGLLYTTYIPYVSVCLCVVVVGINQRNLLYSLYKLITVMAQGSMVHACVCVCMCELCNNHTT